jgi:hypothetical protein
MPIITKPSVIEKNVPASFSLSKSSLAAVTSVAASPWFGDTANWKKVTLNYLSQQYGEMLFVSFDATQVSPTGTWLAPAICQDIFEIVSISITDFANGTFRVPTSELNTAEFLIDMAATSFFTAPLGADTYTIVDNNITKASGVDSFGCNIISTATITSSGYVQFTNNSVAGVTGFLAGLSKDPRESSAASIDYAINNGTLGYEIYESGVLKLRTGSPTDGDIIKVSNNSGVVTYYVNSSLIYTSSTPASGEYYLEVSLFSVGSSLTNCSVL